MTRPGPKAFTRYRSLRTPFWNEITAVSGPTIGLIWSIAASVSHSLTNKYDKVDDADRRRVLNRIHRRQAKLVRAALDHKTPFADGGEVGAARHKGHVRAASGEPGTEIAADAA